MDLQISTRVEGPATVVTVAGEVDVATADQLDAVITGLIAGGSVDLVVDLTSVGFLDSTGLGVLVKAVKRTREADGGVVVVTASERVLKVFSITGLDKAIAVYATVADALAAR